VCGNEAWGCVVWWVCWAEVAGEWKEVVCVLDSPAVVGSSGGVVGFSIEKWG